GQDLAGRVEAAVALLRVGPGRLHLPGGAVRRAGRPVSRPAAGVLRGDGPVQDSHNLRLEVSTTLSGDSVPKAIPPLDVVRILNDVGVRFMLLGTYGIAGWMHRSRATEDVDVLVGLRGHKKAVRALRAAFPQLSTEDYEVVT